jgi:small-conductance mechanosensitive channel
MRATLEAQRADIPGLIDAVKSELQPLKKQREALGPAPQPPQQETPEVAKQRRSLDNQISDLEARLKLLSQADARASALLSQLADLRRDLFTRQLLTRGPSPLEPGVASRAFASLSAVAASIAGETRQRVAEARMDTPTIVRVSLETLLVIVTVLLLRGARLALLRRLVRPVGPESPERRRVIAGIGATLVRLLMPVLALSIVFLAAWNSGFLGPHGKMLLRGLAWTALVMIGAYGLGGAFYSPQAPALRLSQLSEDEAVAAHNWLIALAAVVGLDRLLVVQGETLGLSIEALTLLNVALLALGGIAVWGFALHLHSQEPEAGPGSGPGSGPETAAEDDDDRVTAQAHEIAIGPLFVATLRFVARAIAVVAPLLALIGYYAASRFLFYPMVFSGAVIGFCVLLFYAVQDAVDGLVRPAETEMAGTPSRIRLIPVFLGFFLICAALPVLALVWGADLTDLSNSWRAVSAGFTIGKVTVSPLDFLLFLLVFSVGYVLTRIVQGVLRRSVLPVTGLDAGGKAAISAGVFYRRRTAVHRQQLRLRPDPAAGAADQGGRLGRALVRHGLRQADQRALDRDRDLRPRLADRAQLRADLEHGHQLDPHQSARPGDRAGLGVLQERPQAGRAHPARGRQGPCDAAAPPGALCAVPQFRRRRAGVRDPRHPARRQLDPQCQVRHELRDRPALRRGRH